MSTKGRGHLAGDQEAISRAHFEISGAGLLGGSSSQTYATRIRAAAPPGCRAELTLGELVLSDSLTSVTPYVYGGPAVGRIGPIGVRRGRGGGPMTRRALLCVAAVVALASTGGGIASANYYGPSNGDGCCLFPDNREHTFYFVDTPNQSYVDAMNHAFDHLDNGTNMTTKKVDWTSVTDVLFYARYYGGCCSHGAYKCIDTNSAGECEQAEAKLNRSNLDGEGQHAKEKVACHEVGHTTGLDHAYSVSSCMEQGINGPPKWMADHDKNHINNRYQ